MKRLLKLIVLLLLANTVLQGQYIPLVEEGKFWIYLNYDNTDLPRAVSGHAITIIGDTTINTISYKKVYRLNLKGSHNCPLGEMPCWDADFPYQTESREIVSFIREDTTLRKVYNLPVLNNSNCGNDEILLFDFSLQVGDTLNCNVYESILANSTMQYPGGIVDSIKVIETQSKFRSAMFTFGWYTIVGLPFELEIPIAEGVGYRDFGIFYEPLTEFTDFCEGQIEACNLILSSKTVKVKEQIDVYPNPSGGLFRISLEEENIKSIKAYSILGQLKQEVQFENSIDLSSYEEGVYILEITTMNDKRIIKKVNKLN